MFEAPNLDCMSIEEVREYGLLFGNLHDYAIRKEKAMRARLAGKINEAMMHERRCNELYQKLPDDVRW